jgi:hypothetical protein
MELSNRRNAQMKKIFSALLVLLFCFAMTSALYAAAKKKRRPRPRGNPSR